MHSSCRGILLPRDRVQKSRPNPPTDILRWSFLEILSRDLAQDLQRFPCERSCRGCSPQILKRELVEGLLGILYPVQISCAKTWCRKKTLDFLTPLACVFHTKATVYKCLGSLAGICFSKTHTHTQWKVRAESIRLAERPRWRARKGRLGLLRGSLGWWPAPQGPPACV